MIEYWDKAKLHRVCRSRRERPVAPKLSKSVDLFMRKQVIPRRKKMSALGHVWSELLPPELVEHSCLESIRGGQLRVLVDSSAHMAELDLLVREGLLDQLRELCPSVGLSKIRILRGQWYQKNEEGGLISKF